MKIAVCLRGHMRTYNKFESYIHALRKNHTVDVFIHTWEDLGYFTFNDKMQNCNNVGTINLKTGLINKTEIQNIYETDHVIVESYDDLRFEFEQRSSKFADWYELIKEDVTVDLSRIHGFMSQFYKEQAVIQQKNTYGSGDYDLVIETRPDVYINISDNILEEISIAPNNHIWINQLNFDYFIELEAAWACNSFFIGKDHSLNVLSELYTDVMPMLENHYDIWKTTKNPGLYSRMFCIHRLCWYYLNKRNIELISDINLSGSIIR